MSIQSQIVINKPSFATVLKRIDQFRKEFEVTYSWNDNDNYPIILHVFLDRDLNVHGLSVSYDDE